MKTTIKILVKPKQNVSGSLMLLILAGVFLSVPAFARISIGLESDRKSYIQYEPINITVKLTNYTGNTLNFGDENKPKGSFKLLIGRKSKYGERDKIVERNDIVGNLRLRAGTTRTLTFQVNNMYNFHDAANYRIRAQIGHQRLGDDYQSSAVNIDVRSGINVWTRTIGVPSYEDVEEKVVKRSDGDGEQPIQKRDVSLRRVHLAGEEIYALRVEDEERVYNVARLGKFIHGNKPMCRVDAMSNIFTLIQVKSKLFACKIFDFNGNLMEEDYYVSETTVPALHRSPSTGTVTVVGGRKAVEGEDYVKTSDGIGVRELPSALSGGGSDSGLDEMKRFGQ